MGSVSGHSSLSHHVDTFATGARRPPVTLHGRRLTAARLGTLLFAILCACSVVFSAQRNWHEITSIDNMLGGSPSAARVAEAHQALAGYGLSPRSFGSIIFAAGAIQILVFYVVAIFLLRRKSNELMAMIVAIFLFAMGSGQFPPDLIELQATQPVRATVGLFIDVVFVLGFVSLFFLFPDGRFTPRWTALISIATAASLMRDLLIMQDAFNQSSPVRDALQFGSILVFALIAQIYRYRRVSGPVERQQTKWFLGGLGFALTVFAALNVFVVGSGLVASDAPAKRLIIGVFTTDVVWVIIQFSIPLSLAVAVLRYHLFDIDVIFNRALVYTGLTGAIVGLYVLVVVGFGGLIHSSDNLLLSLTATAIVAIIFQPLRLRLQRAVNRLLYGDRDEPYTVLSLLGRRLEGTLAPNAVLAVIVETVGTALKLPYVAIARVLGADEQLLAAHGIAMSTPVRLPLSHQGIEVGTLLVAPRGPNEPLTRADLELLGDIARQAGPVVQAVQLAIDLQYSRERLVLAREEERLRLRRDLHDGLGPQLAALTLRIETVQEQLSDDPRADELLADLSNRIQDAIVDIRRLVYSLRPPALDDLGLVPALRQASESYGGGGPAFAIEAPEQLPALPAAVEVAAYRIAQEAIANVVRHAAARRCAIRLTVNPTATLLLVEVEDDGRGLPPDTITGVGLHSMRERAEELGGSCTIEPRAGGGTLVRARLPFQSRARSRSNA